jgi:hypothetical protein
MHGRVEDPKRLPAFWRPPDYREARPRNYLLDQVLQLGFVDLIVAYKAIEARTSFVGEVQTLMSRAACAAPGASCSNHDGIAMSGK